MSNENIKKAFALAEKEEQEKEINKIKGIVKAYLEKIAKKKKERDEVQEELKLLEKDLDDLKTGRLDKIEERQEKDEKAKNISIIIIKRIEKEYVPYYPWRSPWIVELKPNWEWNGTQTWISGNSISSGTITVTDPNKYLCDSTYTNCGINALTSQIAAVDNNPITGTMFANFSGGSYNVDGKIINL